MEKRNLFVSGKAVVAAVCGAFTAAFGWLGWLVVAWAACMALDWVSGSAAAASRGAWSSAAARAGIWHKAGMVVVVLVCALTDAVANLIREGKCYQIPSILQSGAALGMHSLNADLARLVSTGRITREAAERCATNKSDLKNYL